MPKNEQHSEPLGDEPKHSHVVLRVASWAVRVALAATFLSAVADRFGLWGPPGTPGVAWGSIEQYES